MTEFLWPGTLPAVRRLEEARSGNRNGHRTTTVETTTGPVTVARPKLRGIAEVFASKLFGAG